MWKIGTQSDHAGMCLGLSLCVFEYMSVRHQKGDQQLSMNPGEHNQKRSVVCVVWYVLVCGWCVLLCVVVCCCVCCVLLWCLSLVVWCCCMVDCRLCEVGCVSVVVCRGKQINCNLFLFDPSKEKESCNCKCNLILIGPSKKDPHL